MSGRVGDLSEEQLQTLEKFRINVKDILQPDHDDYFLLRWLRARNFNLQKSEAMIRKSMEWRKVNKIDTILEDYKPPEILKRYVTGGWFGFDKEGCPILIDPIGRIDPQGILRSAKKSEALKFKIHSVEGAMKVMKDQSAKLGRKIEQEVVIYDLEKLGTRHLWRPGLNLYNSLVSALEDNYPEILKTVFVLNAPLLFPIIWRIIRPFLAEETRKKVNIYGKSGYQTQLLKYIDPDQLPVVYGGTRLGENGDPRCSNLISQGGEVPKDLYSDVSEIDRSNFKEVTVARRSSFEVELEISNPGSVISWQFFTEGYNIGFGVYKKTTSENEIIVEPTKVDSHIYPEDGSVECSETGTYKLLFDNTHSLTRSKKIFYTTEVFEPEQLDSGNKYETVELNAPT